MVSENVIWHEGLVDKYDRHGLNQQTGTTVWLTGLSGAGKSTIGIALEKMLIKNGDWAYRLDGDNLRFGLNNDLNFSPKDRQENVRRTGEVAKLLNDAGIVVIVCQISPYREGRERVKKSIETLKRLF